MLRVVVLVLLTAMVGGAVADDKTKPGKPAFVGTFQVPADRRDAIVRALKENGLNGAFVPKEAAPETLLYRGDKSEYEAAQKIVNKMLQDAEAGLMPKKSSAKFVPVPRRVSARTDDDAIATLNLSAEQMKRYRELRKEADKRLADFKALGPLTPEKMRKGEEHNKWWHAGLKSVLTAKQYQGYLDWWRSEPQFQKPGPERTDEAIFAQLGLNPKQKEELDVLVKETRAASEGLKKLTSGHIEEGLKINKSWRAGLARILTKDQLNRYLTYWGAPPNLAGQ